MKTLSIQQPWASLIAEGVKTIELRGWSTKHRGELLIRASRNSPTRWEDDDGKRVQLPTECLLFVGELVDVRPMSPEDRIGAMSVYWNEEFSWIIQFKYYVHPSHAVGKLKLYDTDDNLIERLNEEQVRVFHPELKLRTRHPFLAKVIRGELVVYDTRNNEQAFITVHLSNEPPLAWVIVPMFSYVGGLRGGDTPITWKEVAAKINEGKCYQQIEDLPFREVNEYD